MEVLFVRSKKPVSQAIMWLMEEPVSHVAMRFDDLVVDAVLAGVRVQQVHKFLEEYEVVYTYNPIVYDATQVDVNKYRGRWYDFLSFAYLGWRGFLRKFFNKPLPSRFPLNLKGAFLCTELATKLLFGKEMLITPYGLYKELTT